ncbi:MAG: hypothetical protein IT423_13685 [Pirellulaceae bacterium]|nr:hypothetical protein [Pirellulaceae bacterium]
MKSGFAIGQIGQLTWTVDASMVIVLAGDVRATVFSTPNMILLMERAAREAIRPFLEDREESVGVLVNIEHMGGATIGAMVRGIARATAIDGRRLTFDVEAWCGDRLIGRGTHTRALVAVDRLIDNLEKLSGSEMRTMYKNVNTGPLPS